MKKNLFSLSLALAFVLVLVVFLAEAAQCLLPGRHLEAPVGRSHVRSLQGRPQSCRDGFMRAMDAVSYSDASTLSVATLELTCEMLRVYYGMSKEWSRLDSENKRLRQENLMFRQAALRGLVEGHVAAIWTEGDKFVVIWPEAR